MLLFHKITPLNIYIYGERKRESYLSEIMGDLRDSRTVLILVGFLTDLKLNTHVICKTTIYCSQQLRIENHTFAKMFS